MICEICVSVQPVSCLAWSIFIRSKEAPPVSIVVLSRQTVNKNCVARTYTVVISLGNLDVDVVNSFIAQGHATSGNGVPP